MKLRWTGVASLGLVLAAAVLAGVYVSEDVAMAVLGSGALGQLLPSPVKGKGSK